MTGAAGSPSDGAATVESLQRHLDEPSARGLAVALSRAIQGGELGSGQQLAPIRTVARELGLSPTTVSAAWSLLVRSGTIRTDGRRGTVVADRRTALPSRYRRALEHPASLRLDLSTGVPDAALLPDLRPALRTLPAAASPSSYLDDPVLPELAALIRSDWPFDAETLTVVDGAMDALDLITSSLVHFGDRVAVDHPCFPPLLDLLEAVGAEVIGVDQDDEGPLPASLAAATATPVSVVYLQPRAHNPTGAWLTPARARALATVLAPTSAVVIENDSAGAVATSPLVSLGTSLPRRVVHIRSYSKSYGPDLRLAAVGGPAAVLDPVIDRRFLGQGWTSRVLQQLLVELLRSSDTQATVHRAAEEYARRRALTVAGLAAAGITIGGQDGLNIWLPVAEETAALLRLASLGIGVSPGSPFAARPGMSPHLRVTTGQLRDGHAEVSAQLAEAARSGGWQGPR